MHQRQKIREKISELVIAANTVAGSRVYTDRVKKIAQSELPAVFIFTASETSKYAMQPHPALERDMSLVVCGFIQRDTSLDDEIDDLSEEIEAALTGIRQLEGYWDHLELKSTEIEVEGEGEKPIASVKLTYQVTYDSPQSWG
jgi:hypothetical protein